MKILLVTPRNPRSFWTYDSILPTLDKGCIFPNLSMPTLAGLTPREHEVVLCDENVEEIDFEVEADVVGITGYIIHRERMFELAAEFRRRGRLVVIGGPYASLCPEEVEPHADVVVMDEAEETWPQFLSDFAAGCWQKRYRAAEKPELTDRPMPRFDLVPVDRYHAMTIQFARGCPFTCEFCDIIVVYGRRPRTKAPEQVMAEIEECHRLGGRQIFIVDDNFIGNKQLAKELLRCMADWGRERDFPMDFQTEVSLNVAQDEELLELMQAANFTTVFIGIESPRPESLTETRKHQNTRADIVESVHKVQSYGIQVQAGMIVGFDHDDARIFEEQLRFHSEARIPITMTGMLQALPKTPLRDRVQAEGRLLAESNGDQFALSNIMPAGMTRLELYRGYRELVRRLYSFRDFRERTVGFLMKRGVQVHGGHNIRRDELQVFGRVARDLLLQSGVRRALFTLGLWTEVLLRRPSVFKEAVSFAVVHKAFADYAEQLVAHIDEAIAAIERDPT